MFTFSMWLERHAAGICFEAVILVVAVLLFLESRLADRASCAPGLFYNSQQAVSMRDRASRFFNLGIGAAFLFLVVLSFLITH